jgi:hypothetical protein
MTPLFSDTSAEAEAVLIQLMRQAPPWRKLEMVDQMNQAVKMLVLAGLQAQHPKASKRQLHRLLADRTLGEELALKVYGPLPEDI